MKRIILPAVLGILSFILLCTAYAGAETVKITGAERVNLRSSPNGKILAKFYENTPAELLETKGQWSRIRIGEDPVSVTGWMMNEFLEPVEDGEWLYIGQDCISSQGHSAVALLDSRKKNARILDVWDGTDPDAVLTVAGVFSGNEWLMTARTADGGDPEWFFASADSLACFESMYVLSRDAASVVSLRAGPGTGAKILGSYFGGVQGNVLFDFDQTEGWTRLCIGGVAGYMMNTFLTEVEFDVPPSRPPLSPLARPSVPVYANSTGKDPLAGQELLTGSDLFSVLGRGKTRVHIRIETEEPGEYYYGWIDQKDLAEQDLVGGSTKGMLSRDTVVFSWDQEERGLLKAGREVALRWFYSTFPSDDSALPSDYCDPGTTQWVWIEAEPADGEEDWISGMVPVEAVQIDENLMIPEPARNK